MADSTCSALRVVNVQPTSHKNKIAHVSAAGLQREAHFHVDWSAPASQTARLSRWCVGDRALLVAGGPTSAVRPWLSDLDVTQLPYLAAVRSRGDNRQSYVRDTHGGIAEDAYNSMTAWYMLLTDRPQWMLVRQDFESRPDELHWQARVPPGAEVFVQASEGVQWRLREAEASAAAPPVPADREQVLELSSAPRQWACWLLSATKLPEQAIAVQIDRPESERACVDHTKPVTVKVRLKSPVRLQDVAIGLYGLEQPLRQQVDLDATGEVVVEFTGRLAATGTVPLVATAEHAAAIGFDVRTCWAPPVVLQSDDAFLDGMYAENLRSMVERRIFNTVPEDEPRYPCYSFDIWPRNITGAVFSALGFGLLGVRWVENFLSATEQFNYLPEMFDINGQAHETWGIDGVGFCLHNLSKLYLNGDAATRREVQRLLPRVVLWLLVLRRAMHGNGMIDDHSEVSRQGSVRTVGSPYAQSQCLVGLRLLSQVLRQCGPVWVPPDLPFEATRLARLDPAVPANAAMAAMADEMADKMAQNLLQSFRAEGLFNDITLDQGQRNPNNCVNLMPGFVWTDPHLGPQRLGEQAMLRRTIEYAQSWPFPGDKRLVSMLPYWPPHPVLLHVGGTQVPMIVNCIATGQDELAAQYLAGLIHLAAQNPREHILSDPHYTRRPLRLEDIGFARYICPEAAIGSHLHVRMNPGNSAAVTPFLELISRMIGVTVIGGRIEIEPHPLGRRDWQVKNYCTPLGTVSYRRTEHDGRVRMHLDTPPVPLRVFVGTSRPSKITLAGQPVEPILSAPYETPGFWVSLTGGQVELEWEECLARATKDQVGA